MSIVGIYHSYRGFSAPTFNSLADPGLLKNEKNILPYFKKVMVAGVQKFLIFRSFFLSKNLNTSKFEHLEYCSGVKLTKFTISSDYIPPHSAHTVYTMAVISGHQVGIVKTNKVISFLSQS